MTERTYDLSALKRVTVAERIQLVGDLWDSVATDAPDEAMPTIPELAADLDRRVRGVADGSEQLLSWDEVQERIRRRTMHRP
jgi:putative addiction module component (TIGR02574 family)